MSTLAHTSTESNTHGLNEADTAAIKGALHQFPDVERATLFGSRALGTAKQGSDVDIALHGALKPTTLTAVRAALSELPLVPYFFDVVHYEAIENEALRAHIDTCGAALYERK